MGYALFGWGGALWVLFLGRIIDGLTGGNFSILAAYIGDVIAPEDRWLLGMFGGAAGAGFIVGPVIGGFATTLGLSNAGLCSGGADPSQHVVGLFLPG